ncbi:MAG: transposase [Planctomycetaceae bacterium]|nr:transposase [Planctomycetaceae bacterium]
MHTRDESDPHGPQPRRTPWHSRGYHPHFEARDVIQSLTFRLHDSVPAELLARWKAELRRGDTAQQRELRARIDRFEDAGHGSCFLRVPRIAELVEHTLLHFDGRRYTLFEWCVMPNHVHALVRTFADFPVYGIVRSWKSFVARRANQFLDRTGAFWMPDYFDRFVRNDTHFADVRWYIRANPVAAGLCRCPEEWRWGSAWGGRRSATKDGNG